MPSLCLLCGAMLIRALCLWVTLQKNDEKTDKLSNDSHNMASKQTESKEVPETSEKEKDKNIDKDDQKEEQKPIIKDVIKENKNAEVTFSIVNIGANYLLVHLLGYAVMNSPLIFSQIGE